MRRRTGLGLTLCAVLVGCLQGSAPPHSTAPVLSHLVWLGHGSGGFSGLEMAADGSGFWALSDRGTLTRAQVTRGALGDILSVQAGPPLALPFNLCRRPAGCDSEGLALAPDGTLYVSFEGPARIGRMESPDIGRMLPVPDAFQELPTNESLEALALAPDGRLWTLPEAADDAGSGFALWHQTSTGWADGQDLPQRGGFRPVSADFGPDGQLYLLERKFLGLAGFASRLSRLDLINATAVTLWQSPPGLYDNLEGLSVWRDAKGVVASMIADDNFLGILHSDIVEIRLND